MKVYFASWLFDKTLGESLTKKSITSRLLSYHFLKEQGITVEQLKGYCQTGKHDTRKRK